MKHKLKSGSQVYKAAEGYLSNPLLKFPRNDPCPCKSGKKFKKCCLPKQPMHVSKIQLAKAEAIAKERLKNGV